MSETVRLHSRSWDGAAIITRIMELATAARGVRVVAETLNAERVPTLHFQYVGADENGIGGTVALMPDLRDGRRWTARRVHDALRHRAVERFDAMEIREKAEWIDDFAKRTNIEPSRFLVLGHELPAFARKVGLGFAWAAEQRPLTGRDVRRIHEAVRDGLDALRESKHVPTIKATDKQAMLQAAKRANSAGWVLPRHRIRLRRIPSPAFGEQTSIYAVYEAPDEVSAIVAAIGHFIWRHDNRWRDCACGRCGLTFVVKGKQKFIEGHGGKHRAKTHYQKHKDTILQKRRERRQMRQQAAGEEAEE